MSLHGGGDHELKAKRALDAAATLDESHQTGKRPKIFPGECVVMPFHPTELHLHVASLLCIES